MTNAFDGCCIFWFAIIAVITVVSIIILAAINASSGAAVDVASDLLICILTTMIARSYLGSVAIGPVLLVCFLILASAAIGPVLLVQGRGGYRRL